MNEKDNMQMRNTMKEMIRLKIKPNFAALGQEYGCNYRTAKIRYYEELNKEKGIGSYEQSRTKFNNDFIPFNKPALQEMIYSKLKNNEIYYSDSKNVNLLNGAIVSSGKELDLCQVFRHTFWKDGSAIKEKDVKIREQEKTIIGQKAIIKEKDSIIERLESKVNDLQKTFDSFKTRILKFCNKICRALGHKNGIHLTKDSNINYFEMSYYAQEINRKFEKSEKDKSDNFEI